MLGWGLGAALLALLLLYPFHWRVTPDSALYIGLAESLAAGEGYVFNGAPHTHAFPGYPLILTPVVAAVGRAFTAFELLNRVALAGAAVLTVALLRRRHRAGVSGASGPPAAGWVPVVAAALAVFTPASFEWGTFLLTEPVHLVFFLAFLLRLEQEADGEGTDLRGTLATAALGMAAFLIRPATITAVGAWGLFRLLSRDRWRTLPTAMAIGTALAMVAFLVAWFARANAVAAAEVGYEKEIAQQLHALGPGVVLGHLRQLAHHGSWAMLGVKAIPLWIGIGFLLAAIRGAVHLARAGVRPTELVLVAFLVGLLAFPFLPDRYLVPVLPILVYLVVVGIARTLAPLSPARLVAVLGVAAGAALVAEAQVLRTTRQLDSFTVRWLVVLVALVPPLLAFALTRLRGRRSGASSILAVAAAGWLLALILSDVGLIARHRIQKGTTSWGTLHDPHWDAVLAAIDPLRGAPPTGLVVTPHVRVTHLWTGWPTARPSVDPDLAPPPAEVAYVLTESGCFDPAREAPLDAYVARLGLPDPPHRGGTVASLVAVPGPGRWKDAPR